VTRLRPEPWNLVCTPPCCCLTCNTSSPDRREPVASSRSTGVSAAPAKLPHMEGFVVRNEERGTIRRIHFPQSICTAWYSMIAYMLTCNTRNCEIRLLEGLPPVCSADSLHDKTCLAQHSLPTASSICRYTQQQLQSSAGFRLRSHHSYFCDFVTDRRLTAAGTSKSLLISPLRLSVPYSSAFQPVLSSCRRSAPMQHVRVTPQL
jgi:hypothetical protein